MTDLRKRLIGCFSAVFPQLSQDEILLATIKSVASWDSLAGVTLILVIEEEFGVQISSGVLEQFVSFELVLDYLQRTLSNPSNRSIQAPV